MNLRIAFSRAQPFIIGAGIPLVLGVLAIILPIQFSQSSSIAVVSTKIDQIRLDIDKVEQKIDSIDKRFQQNETDPEKVIAKLLGISADDANIATLVLFNEKLVALPKTEEAKLKFEQAGFASQQISPTVFGVPHGKSRCSR